MLDQQWIKRSIITMCNDYNRNRFIPKLHNVITDVNIAKTYESFVMMSITSSIIKLAPSIKIK